LQHGFNAKFWVHWQAAQAVHPCLAEDGSIVFLTAASSRLANPATSGLAAINGALERMSRTLARELAPIRVNAVSRGVVDTRGGPTSRKVRCGRRVRKPRFSGLVDPRRLRRDRIIDSC
jgi:NAD(P)-dependent dehydrogenase (short-subunit alcohol dehydrogenase family)